MTFMDKAFILTVASFALLVVLALIADRHYHDND